MPDKLLAREYARKDMLGGKRALIIDDDPDFRATLALQLAFYGCETDQAGDGAEGVEVARLVHPDVILADLQMPVKNGLEVCAMVREDPQLAGTPIMVITSDEQRENILAALNAGANDVLKKPVEPLELAVKIRNLVTLRLVEEMQVTQSVMQETIAAIEQVKREWELTLDCIDDIIMLTDRSGRILRCNRILSDLVGKPFAEMLGKSWQDLLTDAGFTHSMGDVSPVEYRAPNGAIYDLSIVYVPQATGIHAAVVRLINVTSIREAQRALQQSHQLLTEQNTALEAANAEMKAMQSQMIQQEKMSSIGQLAAGVAHEINNPIGFISSNLNTLRRYAERLSTHLAAVDAILADAPAEIRQSIYQSRKDRKIDYVVADIEALVKESLEGTERVNRIVQDLKSFSHVDEAVGKMADINAGMESTINIVWNELKYRATVVKEYGDIPQTFCNLGQLNQVFMNMLVNAVHAIETQGTISVKTWSSGNDIFIRIADTGSGIPPDKLQKIFEPFFTTKEIGKGTGLGLSIAYDIVKRHDGDIQVESELGKGTAFTIRIPLVVCPR